MFVLTVNYVDISGYKNICVTGTLYGDCEGTKTSLLAAHCVGIAGTKMCVLTAHRRLRDTRMDSYTSGA